MKAKHFDLFERYYNGEMEPGEKASFEESLAGDPALNAAYQEYLSIYEALGDRETLDLRTKLKEIREENSRIRKGNNFLSQGYNWLWMAALITVIISFTTIISLMIKRMDARDGYTAEITAMEKPSLSELDRELLRFDQRQIEFNVDSPRDTIFFDRKDPLVFRWSVDSTEPIMLELIDWRGKIVFSSGLSVKSPYIVDKRLPAGFLTFRFRTETETFKLGFIYLR